MPFSVRSILSSRLPLVSAAGALAFASLAGGAEPAINGYPLHEVATAIIETPANTYWAGELFPLTHRVRIVQGFLGNLPAAFEWSAPNLIAEDWSAPVRSAADGYDVVTQTARGYVRTPGSVTLPATTRPLTLVTARAGDGSPITEPFSLPTPAPQLTIRPLPQPAPTAFSQAVGDFALQSRVTAQSVAVGESVTWTLELTGTGNWAEIGRVPGRVVSKDFQAVAPVTKRTFKPGELFTGSLTEDVLLVPSKAGEYQLGPVRFVYFDPKRGRYQMLTTDTFVLKVGAGAGGGGGAAARELEPSGVRTPVPDAPPPLPLDPLSARHRGGGPLPVSWLVSVMLVGALAVLGCWLRLAAARSKLTDPLYPKRRARARLEQILGELERGGLPPDGVRRLLFAWQKAAAELGGLTLSTPTAADIADALEGTGTRGSSWAHLWRDANRALYGEQPKLVSDWVMRAKAALSETRIAEVPLRSTFLPRNLIPFAIAGLAFALAPLPARASEGESAYLQGDFAAAEKSWRQVVAVNPLNAHARYNLALAAAQQDRWSEAAAQSLAAFCLEPRNPAIRWQLALSVDRAGIDHRRISALAHGTSVYRLAGVLAPGEWGLAIMAGSVAGAAALAVFLFALYRHRPRWQQWTAGTTAAAAITVVAAGWVSLACYGPLADNGIAVVARNVLLCSVPTEIDTAQKTAPLPAGSLAKVDRTFLGWSRLVFANGQTGWARTDAVVRLYR